MALCLMALMLVIAYATNTGIVVNDRIRMQKTADLATYAVAYSQAGALNDLVEANREIADAVKSCRQTLESRIWTTPCNCATTDPFAEAEILRCKTDIDVEIAQFVSFASYDRSVKPALKAGERTAEANFTGSARHTTFFQNRPGSPTARGTYRTRYSMNFAGGGVVDSIADFEQVQDTYLNYQYMTDCGCRGLAGPFTRMPVAVSTWFYKDDKDPDVWVAGRVKGTPDKRFLDTDYRTGGSDRGYFGASSTGGDDELVAYAVAKPYDGSVGPSEINGYQRNGNWIPNPVYSGSGVRFPKLAMVDEYRARMAGIQDDLSGPVSASVLIQQDGASLGKSWDVSKFEH